MQLHQDLPRLKAYAPKNQTQRTRLERATIIMDTHRQRMETDLRICEADMREVNHYIERYEADLLEARDRVQALLADKDRITHSIATHVPKDVARALRQLEKHAYCAKVFIENEHVSVITHPIFTDIRKEAGTQASERTLLGIYRVNIRGENAIEVKNLTFSHRPHWATQGGNIPRLLCLGEWQKEIARAFKEGNFAVVFDTVIHLLKAANQDDAAYTRSHLWKLERVFPGSANDANMAIAWPFAASKKGYTPRIGEIVYVHDYGPARVKLNRATMLDIVNGRTNQLGSYEYGVEFIEDRGFHSLSLSGKSYAAIGHGLWVNESQVFQLPLKLRRELAKITLTSNRGAANRAFRAALRAYSGNQAEGPAIDKSLFEWLDGFTEEEARSPEGYKILTQNT
jgi:hypothetical protein